MHLTFEQACEDLKASTNAYGADDVGASINKALRALVQLAPFRCFRRVYRFCSAGPRFVLPQGSAGLVRACVNGRPVTMRGQDFKFMLSGPGDMERPPFCRCRVSIENICDCGVKPVMLEPLAPFLVFATVDHDDVAEPGQPPLTVRGITPDGRDVTVRPSPIDESLVYDGEYTLDPGDTILQTVTSVSVDRHATRYVKLWAVDAASASVFPIAVYNPKVRAPSFRHYELTGWPPGRPVEILAEVRMDHIDLVDPGDVLPIDSTEPIEWLIRADWEMKAGETQRGEAYRQKAIEWLQRADATDATVQTKLTINSEFHGSQGEISRDAVNI